MKTFKKILLVVAAVLLSAYFLFIFVLYNFPYESIIKRADTYLRNNYSVSLRAGNVRYRFPFRLLAEDIRIHHEKDSVFVTIDKVRIHFRLLSFSRSKQLGIDTKGGRLNSSYVTISKADTSLMLKIRPRPLLAGEITKGLDSLGISMSDALVEKLYVTGFEFSSFEISQLELLLSSSGEGFNFDEARIKSELFSSEISGKTDLETIEMTSSIVLLDEFFRRYASLRGVVDSISENDTIKIQMRGSIKNPSVRLIEEVSG